ncbi:MAG: GHMP kinase [Opitutaceae bacterium]|nr:GHMP kinase [Opitutaceae bacterium]
MIISQTPFRISFAGGGSDLPEFYREAGYGAVVSSAIDKFVYLAIHRFFERKFVLKYSRTEICDGVEDIQHPLMRECLRAAGTCDFLEITSFADIPSTGSGLGSSSAFAVGLLHALLAQRGRMPSHETCAALASEVEIERLREPIGKQDQYAAAYGGINYIRFRADGAVEVDPIILARDARAALEGRLALFFTGVTRQASGILAEQRRNIVTDRERFENLAAMRDQADVLREALGRGEIDAVGTTLHEGWLRKRRMASGISSPEFDAIYGRARQAGASGGKLLGAGGGGFFLFYVEPEKRSELVGALGELRMVDFRLERQGTRIIYVGD